MAWNPLSRFGRASPEATPPAAPAAPPPGEIALPDRQCGSCTECCKVLTILTPELKKPPGVLCVHCDDGGGCRVYASRPSVCRGFLCGWRQLAVLEDQWRPDRCGIIVTFTNEHVPAKYAPHTGIQFELFRDARTVITWQPFVNYLIELIRNGMPVFLQVPGEPGFEPARLLVNDLLIASVALRDYGRVILDLTGVLARCESFEKRLVRMD